MEEMICNNLQCDWFGTDHTEDTPCGLAGENPGADCRYCSREVLVGENACPNCWTPVEDVYR